MIYYGKDVKELYNGFAITGEREAACAYRSLQNIRMDIVSYGPMNLGDLKHNLSEDIGEVNQADFDMMTQVPDITAESFEKISANWPAPGIVEKKLPYPEYIMKTLRESKGLEPYDESKDTDISSMSKTSVFEAVLNYEGDIGAVYHIMGLVKGIFGVDLEKS